MLDINLIRKQFDNLNMFKNTDNAETEANFIKICNNIAFQPVDFLKLTKNLMSNDWKTRFVELIGLEALLEVILCFDEYAAIPNNSFLTNMSSCVLEYFYAKSPRWVAWRLSQALLHAQFVTFQDTPFVKLLIEVIDHTVGRKLFLTYPTPSTNEVLPDTILIGCVGSDLDAIIEAIMAEVFTPTSHRYFTLSTILIQDSIFTDFDKKLLAKCDIALKQRKMDNFEDDSIKEIVESASNLGARTKVFSNNIIRGAIIYDLKPQHQERDLPVLSVIPFRTTTEALKLADNLGHFCAASVWGTDPISSFVKQLNYSTIWINSYGLTHPAVTLCADRMCRYISTKESGVLYEYDELKVGNGAKNLIKDLMLINEMESYIKVLQKWLTVENVAVPADLNVITKNLGPVGMVMVPWRKDGKELAINLLIPALACGNQVRLCVDDEEKENAELFLNLVHAAVPAGVIEIGKLGELYGMHPYGNTVDRKSGWRKNLVLYSDSPEKQELLWQFVNCQYIWLEQLQM